EGSQFLEPDGRFPNHIPNPEAAEAMDSIAQAVVRVGADLGVIFDADCDRAALVDASGRPIHRNRLIAMVSAI
ncbi:MAG: phosphomannomutase/phosphoglucomutase, partial [Clostridia bacterium]